ncbi:MAG: iron-sulfur cluster insertion protein ErpA [Kiloniellales bacterium]
MPDSAPLPAFSLSESAATRINALVTQEQTGSMLRVSVSGGGCSGFQYGFDFDTQVEDDDRVFERDGAKVVIDETSLELLTGSQIDFVEDLMGSYFKIENPQAESACGCGSSFSISL